jgi:hypothetical protein
MRPKASCCCAVILHLCNSVITNSTVFVAAAMNYVLNVARDLLITGQSKNRIIYPRFHINPAYGQRHI